MTTVGVGVTMDVRGDLRNACDIRGGGWKVVLRERVVASDSCEAYLEVSKCSRFLMVIAAM